MRAFGSLAGIGGVWQYYGEATRGGTAVRAKQKNASSKAEAFFVHAGDDLLSHMVPHAVPSALKGLTAVFGMGTGVSPSP